MFLVLLEAMAAGKPVVASDLGTPLVGRMAEQLQSIYVAQVSK